MMHGRVTNKSFQKQLFAHWGVFGPLDVAVRDPPIPQAELKGFSCSVKEIHNGQEIINREKVVGFCKHLK